MTTKITTLPSGLRVVTDSMEHIETASIGLWVGVGTRNEDEADNGVAHLVEHMLFKGTGRRSAFDISAEMENVGGHLNAYTTREATAYYSKVLKQDVALAADVLCDMMQNSTLDEGELDRERGVIIQEIGQSIDQPDDILFDYLQKTAYPNSGLGRPVLGSAAIIGSIARDRLAHYINANYAGPQMIFAAAGAVNHDQMVDYAHKHLTNIPSTAQTKTDSAEFHSGDMRENRDIEQLHVALAFKGLSFLDKDYFALSVLSTLLGGGMSSRLFQEVREKRGLVYSIYSFVSAHKDGGNFGIYAGTDPEKINELLPVVAEQMQLITKHVTAEELNRAKAQLRSSLFMSQESTMSRAEKLAFNQLMYNRMIPNSEILERIDAVSEADIKRLALMLLQHAPASAFVGPLREVPDASHIAAPFKA
ncbi:MAG: insulinase family protein [Alphaproteobacteria bacterium]|nr:insulinase family protein [Alphaproteobacteria bacterium]